MIVTALTPEVMLYTARNRCSAARHLRNTINRLGDPSHDLGAASRFTSQTEHKCWMCTPRLENEENTRGAVAGERERSHPLKTLIKTFSNQSVFRRDGYRENTNESDLLPA